MNKVESLFNDQSMYESLNWGMFAEEKGVAFTVGAMSLRFQPTWASAIGFVLTI